MATLTRLASTLTAKFSPSQTLTDAFYIDGRLCGKRETRAADITIEKEERGYFFSVFTHPTVEGLEPGMLPPFEPQFRSLCNDVKFGHKEIDGLIEKFLSTAVEVTGKMRLSDSEMRSPYFSGIIVRDAEAFAVTVGNGLAFLYRDDTLFPLTDAGIPMEAIDAFDNRVGDFMYYCASKTANALWSNYFTLSPDDCIILCNKAVYDALGQRELLRILNEAEDQCDAAGTVITQAAARMPNVPMQFSISFVENVTNTDKRGIFGFKKKAKEEDESENNVESVMEGGVVGAAAEAISDAGFVSLTAAESAGTFVAAGEAEGVVFGEQAVSQIPVPPVNQVASPEQGIEVSADIPGNDAGVEFLDDSVASSPSEVQITPEDLLKNSLGEMKTISVSEYNPETSTDDEPTKPVTNLDPTIFAGLKEGGVLASAIKDSVETSAPVEEAPVIPVAPAAPVAEEPVISPLDLPQEEPVVVQQSSGNGEIVFDSVDDAGSKFMDVPSEESFNPYSAGDPDEMKNAAPLIFGDDSSAKTEGVKAEPSEEVSEIPVPDFEIDNPKPELKEDDKLNVDFPADDVVIEPEKTEAAPVSEEFTLPFANAVETEGAPEAVENIPDMPQYDANVYDTPVNAINSEQPISAQAPDSYAYGTYDNMNQAAPAPEAIPYQPYGSETFASPDQTAYQNDDVQQFQTNPADYSGYADAANNPYSSEPVGSASSSTNAGDDAWIMDLLGVDDNYGNDAIPDAGNFVAGGQPQAAPAASPDAYAARGGAYETQAPGPNGRSAPAHPQRPSGQRPAGQRPAGGAGSHGGGGNKPKFRLNRNGYIFIAFVVLLIVCLAIIISLIVKSCSDKTPAESSSTNDSNAVIISTDPSDITTASTEQSTETTPENPSAPIGSFKFSEYVGYRTWWDLFHYVYNINLQDLSDPKIQIIKDYNGFDASYTGPNAGDVVLLPPEGVLDGTIPNTFVPGGAQSAETTAADDGVEGQAGLVDNGADNGADNGENPD
ncbi:MAG: hypothetical protein J6Z43_09005 [Clostridiales bacterium]|nr:hypothetical protein [Clostridiales bacterium]